MAPSDTLRGTDPEGYDEFVELFAEVYGAVKEASPETSVFTVFQLERMKGLWGGLFGEGFSGRPTTQTSPSGASWTTSRRPTPSRSPHIPA
jgi:hypothetical protein